MSEGNFLTSPIAWCRTDEKNRETFVCFIYLDLPYTYTYINYPQRKRTQDFVMAAGEERIEKLPFIAGIAEGLKDTKMFVTYEPYNHYSEQ